MEETKSIPVEFLSKYFTKQVRNSLVTKSSPNYIGTITIIEPNKTGYCFTVQYRDFTENYSLDYIERNLI